MATPTGTLTKKIHCHETSSVSTPPSSRPNAAPPAAIALHTPSAFVRSPVSLNVVDDDRQRRGRDERAAEALDAAADDQHRRGLREAVEQRGDREQRDPGHEQPLAPDQVGGAAAEHQEAAEHERVAR